MKRVLASSLFLGLAGAVFATPIPDGIQQLLGRYCLDCHDADNQKGELDLERFSSTSDIEKDSHAWEKVLHQIQDGEMPPKEKPQFTYQDRQTFTAWVTSTLDQIALDNAGDPGPVVLRRLSNWEFTYTLRDLTGVDTLHPARQFPADNAAGEGFTNVGAAMAMSPAMVTKYLDAAKEVASHAVLLPDGIGWSPYTSRADWTRERLEAIRAIYDRYTNIVGVKEDVVQGVNVTSKEGGAIPLESYLQALLGNGSEGPAGLSPKYLTLLKNTLESNSPSPLLDPLRERFRKAKPSDIPAIAADIRNWQRGLWHFAKVGHIGKRNGPPSWQIPVSPMAISHLVRIPVPESGDTVSLYLVAGEAGDGNDGDIVVWRDAILNIPGKPGLPIDRIEDLHEKVASLQETHLHKTAAYLEASTGNTVAPGLDKRVLAGWRAFAGLEGKPPSFPPYLPPSDEEIGGDPNLRKLGNYVPNATANRTSETVKIGSFALPARGITIHPSRDEDAVVIWQSPFSGNVRIRASAEKMDHNGNGVVWALDLVDKWGPRRLAGDALARNGRAEFQSDQQYALMEGDLLKISIGAKDGHFYSDTTAVSLTVIEAGGKARAWDLAGDVVDQFGKGNPLPDSLGNPKVWHFCQAKVEGKEPFTIPVGTTLGKWRDSIVRDGEPVPAAVVQEAILSPQSTPDKALVEEIRKWGGAFNWMGLVDFDPSAPSKPFEQAAPSVREFRIPAGMLHGGAEFFATVSLKRDAAAKGSSQTTAKGSVQAYASLSRPQDGLPLVPGKIVPIGEKDGKSWSAGIAPVGSDRPILVHSGSSAQALFDRSVAEFQMLFPAALCYRRIVPIDEVVTLTLHYREDGFLQRLMLDDKETAELDRLWDGMRFVSREPFLQLDAFQQLWQFATQDADPSAFEPMRDPVNQGVVAFKQRLISVEPVQLRAVVDFASQAWRRPLREAEEASLQSLYLAFRKEGLGHDAALRQLLARILASPDFLYRKETPGAGSRPTPLGDWEIASRLSYFLWSSAPDGKLSAEATAGRLQDPDNLAMEARRMLQVPKARRLATEFGAQWLHVRDIASLDEKSERHFPSFLGLREDMQEEVVLFFTDFFKNNRPVRSLLDADHSFMTPALAQHNGVTIPEGKGGWQRIDGLRQKGRGGVLGFSATLAKQSGASRTSPILRGNWVSEALLGEKLPKPPKNVPILPDEPPSGLTERQLIERHSQDPACAKCHAKIDPFGFALEGFDAIGRFRGGVDTKVTLPSGAKVDGLVGLRNFILESRLEEFSRQFCRKLLGYALGRSVQLSDKPLLDKMVAQTQDPSTGVWELVSLIVTSPQFRNIRGADF
jgi:hypothetical protein